MPTDMSWHKKGAGNHRGDFKKSARPHAGREGDLRQKQKIREMQRKLREQPKIK